MNGYRKFYKTQAEKATDLKSGIVERLMGHHGNLDPNYWKMTPEELLEEYVKAIPYLTIEKQDEVKDISKQKMQMESKDKEIQEVKQQMALMQEHFECHITRTEQFMSELERDMRRQSTKAQAELAKRHIEHCIGYLHPQ